MAQLRYSGGGAIRLPNVTPEMEPFKRAIEDYFARISQAGVFPVHEIDLVNPPRGGAANGQQLVTGAVYVDKDGFLKMTQSSECWAIPLGSTVTSATVVPT